jgi:hypothetical protein
MAKGREDYGAKGAKRKLEEFHRESRSRQRTTKVSGPKEAASTGEEREKRQRV